VIVTAIKEACGDAARSHLMPTLKDAAGSRVSLL
jgi:hypothetical protein